MNKNTTIFEHAHRGAIWRLLAVQYKDHEHCDWRRWYWDEDGVLKASRDGMTFPITQLPEIYAAIGEYLAGDTPVHL